MQCTRCGRLTLKPALILAGLAYGPTCAKKMFVIEKRKQPKKQQVERDTKTMDLFADE